MKRLTGLDWPILEFFPGQLGLFAEMEGNGATDKQDRDIGPQRGGDGQTKAQCAPRLLFAANTDEKVHSQKWDVRNGQ